MKKKQIWFGTLASVIVVGLSVVGYFQREKISEKLDDIHDWYRRRRAPEVADE